MMHLNPGWGAAAVDDGAARFSAPRLGGHQPKVSLKTKETIGKQAKVSLKTSLKTSHKTGFQIGFMTDLGSQLGKQALPRR